jgi:hypothetical protein
MWDNPYKDRCAWCRNLLADVSDIVAVAIYPGEEIPCESAQYIDLIIFLQLEEEPLTFAKIFKGDDPLIGDKKAIPVFVIPLGEDGQNFVAKTCDWECAEKLRHAIENEAFTLQWNFAD